MSDQAATLREGDVYRWEYLNDLEYRQNSPSTFSLQKALGLGQT